MENKKKTRNNRRNRHRNKAKNPNAQAQPANGQRNNPKNNRKKKPLKADEIVSKYDNLMSQYLNVRKKYFDQHHKLGVKKKDALMRNYTRSLEELERFAARLKPWQREILESERTEAYPLDTQYSSANDLGLVGEIEEGSENFTQVHLNELQRGRPNYADDKEATTGTMDDYKAYKESIAS